MDRLEELIDDIFYIGTSLRMLEEILKLPSCMECAKYGGCEYMPERGGPTRYNCPLFDKGDE